MKTTQHIQNTEEHLIGRLVIPLGIGVVMFDRLEEHCEVQQAHRVRLIDARRLPQQLLRCGELPVHFQKDGVPHKGVCAGWLESKCAQVQGLSNVLVLPPVCYKLRIVAQQHRPVLHKRAVAAPANVVYTCVRVCVSVKSLALSTRSSSSV